MKKLKFLVICLFFLLSGCLSKKNPIEVITRIFPKKVSIPLKNLDKKFWFALINGSPIESGKYFVNCFHFKDISKNDITWASTVYNPRLTTANIENKIYQPIPEVARNKVNIYFETEDISGVETVVSDYFILYVDVEGDYFNEKNIWGGEKISKFLFPKNDFIKNGSTFSGKTIAQLVVLADYEEDAKGDKIKLNWAQSVYVDDFPLLKLEEKIEKIEKIKKVLIARNKGFIKSGSIFESLWVEHRAVSEDDELISKWKVKSDAIGGSLKDYDCGVTYDSKGELVN